jgi:hypothetical protein
MTETLRRVVGLVLAMIVAARERSWLRLRSLLAMHTRLHRDCELRRTVKRARIRKEGPDVASAPALSKRRSRIVGRVMLFVIAVLVLVAVLALSSVAVAQESPCTKAALSDTPRYRLR